MCVVGKGEVERPSRILIQLMRPRSPVCVGRRQRGGAFARSGRNGRRRSTSTQAGGPCGEAIANEAGCWSRRSVCCSRAWRCLPPGAIAADDEDELPGRVGRVADFGGELFLVAAGSAGRLVADRAQLPGHLRRQPLGRRRRSRRNRLRRRPVPSRRRHQPARLAPRRSPAGAVRRPGPGDRPPALPRSRRGRDRRHAEHPDPADAARPLPDRGRARTAARRRWSSARARRWSPSPAAPSRCCPGRSATADGRGTGVRRRAQRDRASTASTPGAPTATAATSAAARRSYVSRQMVGWADLDEYGSWDTHPTYGAVWYPDRRSPSAGRRIATAAGRTSAAGAGPGSTTRPGATRRRTTVAGRGSAVAGAGAPGAFVARPVWAPALVGWVRRLRLGGVGHRRRPGLRLGAAGLGRPVRPVVGPRRLRPALLVALQPPVRGAVRGQPRRAAARVAGRLFEQPRSRRDHRGRRGDDGRRSARSRPTSSRCRPGRRTRR